MSSTTVTEITLDTNILFYAFDPADERKHAIASTILETCYRRVAPVALQCLSEFYRSATRKHLLLPSEATEIVNDLRSGVLLIEPLEEDLVSAMQLHQKYKLQFFDALLIATMHRAGCHILFSEDMDHQENYDGITVLNPFKLPTDELNRLLA